MYGGSNIETYITISEKDHQWEFAVWLIELQLGMVNNLEGSDGEEGGREVQEGGYVCIPIDFSCWCLAETNTIL